MSSARDTTGEPRSGEELSPLGRSLRNSLDDERGVALVLVILVVAAVMAITVAAFTVQSNAEMIHRYADRQSKLEAAARSGIEETRSDLNAPDGSITYPDSGYVQVEDSVQILDAAGETVSGVRRSTWVGPTGITSGQYGVFGSIVVRVADGAGNQVVRHQRVRQESFAKYAYFTSIEPSSIAFGGGDQLFGPVHSNDDIRIYSSGATFHDEVTTAENIQGAQYGEFPSGYQENVSEIPMPETQDLEDLRDQAQDGNTEYVGSTAGGTGEATTRIHFLTIDLDGDGSATGENEGFMRVYQSSDAEWVTAAPPSSGGGGWGGGGGNDDLRDSENCGHYHPDGTFVPAADHPENGPDDWVAAISNSRRRCYLGGSDSLSNGFVADDGNGEWLDWSGSTPAAVSGRPDAAHLVPLSRNLNPDFKGVVFVEGDVAVSGKLRGSVTLAATGEIVVADDVTYATDPGAGSCVDMLGLFAGEDVVVADNTLNSPISGGPGNSYRTYDDTGDEFIHAVVLTLNQFTVANYDDGSETDEHCESTVWGRGCLYLTGGIIQRSRGPVGTDTYGAGGTGYLKRYSYDSCAASDPPPYFPTTGHFTKGTFYEVDPSDFSVGQLFDRLTPG